MSLDEQVERVRGQLSEKEVSDLLKAHFGLRMQKGTQQLTNHSQLKHTRRDIARAKTILVQPKTSKESQ